MGVINFLAFIFAAALGFGLAFWIAATILNKNNNIGDSRGESRLYSSGVSFTDISDKMSRKEDVMHNYIDHFRPKKASYPTAPRGRDLVEKPKK